MNSEDAALPSVLADLPSVVRPGGVVVVLTYQNMEDRLVKAAFKDTVYTGAGGGGGRTGCRDSPAGEGREAGGDGPVQEQDDGIRVERSGEGKDGDERGGGEERKSEERRIRVARSRGGREGGGK